MKTNPSEISKKSPEIDDMICVLLNRGEASKTQIEASFLLLYELCLESAKFNLYYFHYKDTVMDDEDFAHDILILVLDKINSYDESKGGFRTWLNYIGKGVVSGEKKKRRLSCCSYYDTYGKDQELTVIDMLTTGNSTEDEVLSSCTSELLWELMPELPEHYRQAIDLCEMQDMKPSDAAKILKCKPSDVSIWKCRALNKLRKLIEERELKEDLYPDLVA